MGFTQLLLLSLGLSMDAFAVSLCQGLQTQRIRATFALKVALLCGGFQALMPLLGYLVGIQFYDHIHQYQNWIAFTLLSLIGLNMIRAALSSQSTEEADIKQKRAASSDSTLILLAFATSIDALTLGITLAALGSDIATAATTIGITTFLLTYLGVYLGASLGERCRTRAEILGGIILIGIGAKILIESC